MTNENLLKLMQYAQMKDIRRRGENNMEERINIMNLINGNMLTFSGEKSANDYVKWCITRKTPITINYGKYYVNENDTMTQNKKTPVSKIIA